MANTILQIVADGSPGGGTTAVLGLCADLVIQGEWTVALLTEHDSYAAELGRALGLQVLETRFFRSRFDPLPGRDIQSAINKIGPKVVHAHGARAGLPTSQVIGKSIPFVYTVHGFHFLQKTFPTSFLARKAEKFIASKASAVIFVSEADKNIAKRFGIVGNQIEVIRNGIEFSDFELTEHIEKSFDIVMSGRLHQQKNPLFAIEVLDALPDRNTNMLVVGGGPLEAEMKALAISRGLESRVRFVGAKPRNEALRLLQLGRLFLFPSRWEGLPIAPIEALAVGVPVIASDIEGTREVVQNGKTGILIGKFDPFAYAHEIQLLLSDTKKLREMAAAGRADVNMNFLRTRSSKAHASLYSKIRDDSA